jgi:hypothetical protein
VQECRELVNPLDHQGLLSGSVSTLPADTEGLDDDALLAELGIEIDAPPDHRVEARSLNGIKEGSGRHDEP